jgi:DNA-directed RNA polymerase subunit RPC12/RpoP
MLIPESTDIYCGECGERYSRSEADNLRGGLTVCSRCGHKLGELAKVRTQVQRSNPHPWNPLHYNGWHEVGRDDWQPEPDTWVLVYGVSVSGRDRVGVGCTSPMKGSEASPSYWTTWPHGMRVTHWMDQPHPPGSAKLNDAALLDWAGENEGRIRVVARHMDYGYSIREAFRLVVKAITNWRPSDA